jgi:7-carboxy-7-deazaguanine synthase
MTQYPVNTIYRAIQGEGSLTGTPMILVRLQGCNVFCDFCDTKETWTCRPGDEVSSLKLACRTLQHYVRVGADQVFDWVTKVEGENKVGWVLLTGGEPTLYNLEPLCKVLQQGGYSVALETNGTMPFDRKHIDWVAVSPKISVAPEKVLFDTLVLANEVKFVIGSQEDLQLVDEFLSVFWDEARQGKLGVPYIVPLELNVVLQPMSQDHKATDLCIETCTERGWRLSIQIHKYLNIP